MVLFAEIRTKPVAPDGGEEKKEERVDGINLWICHRLRSGRQAFVLLPTITPFARPRLLSLILSAASRAIQHST
jgi:hypothetical protein